MPKLTKEFIEGIQQIPVEELQRFVIKAARKDKALFDLLNLEYLKKEDATEELFEATNDKITGHLINVSLRGPVQRSCAAAISKAVKEINYFAQVTRDKYREAQLLNILLDDVFEEYTDDLGTCWTVLDSKLGVTTKRLLNLVTSKLHEDYLMDFRDDLNRYLKILHTHSNHIDLVYALPEKI